MALFYTQSLTAKFRFIFFVVAVIGYSDICAQNFVASQTVNSNTTVNRRMQWNYGGYRFTLDIPLNINTYNYYKALSKRNSYASYAQEHPGYPYLSQLAEQLKADADQLSYTGWELANYLTAFVQQNIVYTKDPFNNGLDYPKFPIETLFEKQGDCEDSAILLVTLLKLFGFDALLIQIPGHMAVGITCENCNSYYNYEGKKYAYIETTNPNWKIGNMPSEYKNTSAQLIKTPGLSSIQNNLLTTPMLNKNECACKSGDKIKTITIEGKTYAIKSNETIELKQNGVIIRISNTE